MVLEELEINSLNKLNNIFMNDWNKAILIYKRYVEDCFLIVKKDKEDKILEIFNNFKRSLQFTIENEH